MSIGDRGSYSKGIARRKQILQAALTIVAVDGFDQTTLSKISKAVGITDVGVLHYFDSMDDLMIEVLRQRDIDAVMESSASVLDLDSQMSRFGRDPAWSLRYLIEVMDRNSRTPGLIELFAHMAVKASDPKSPAYRYFKHRGTVERKLFGHVLRNLIKDEHLQTKMSPDELSRVMQALLGGLQVQWLIDRNLDMPAVAEKSINALLGRSPSKKMTRTRTNTLQTKS
ncbi:MAG: TetR/AcrR family transcriptional regulator [Bifidobacterium psychraerophilum]|jgi:AcrR family transcriptional regulator|uniref:TetR/AcrR family transcriptional regulator n=1 Tax=Bifidobacterium psychraerophilum TaxID=218140 RepID=UPI0023F66F69|nr:TetR/AcrR family transcriptional regulator [Bifidobacterium psychraerophilum]MCI2177494.1 TetR/AcrR family transcriptional regulator [Bifidobacterium psychraerophilum]MCI2182833.1 TetR/AcrR family transcriptional regulator [Bifidobacterium psychraerophilum]